MDNELKCLCQHRGLELPPTHTGPCPKCGGNVKDRKVISLVSIGVKTYANSKARQKGLGFSKFKKETLQGNFPSGDPKYKNGVVMTRIIDKEKKEIHHIVKDATTKEIVHEEHETLEQHNQKKNQTLNR